MTEEESFIRHIRADPADEVPRLIYADYLEERGDPRGEFIRVQCELAALQVGDPRRLELAAREQELLAEHAEDWLAPLRALGAIGVSSRCFQRGLIERVKMEADEFVRNGRSLCAIAPGLHVVELRGAAAAMELLAQMDMPAQIRGLDLSFNRLGASQIAQLASAMWPSRIEELSLAFNDLGDEGTAELARVSWPNLRVLALDRNRIGPVGARALAAVSWPSLPSSLTSVSLPLNPLRPVGIRHLARSAAFGSLQSLDLAGTGCDLDAARSLAQSTGLKSLKRLNLRGNGLPASAIRELAESPNWSLQRLDVRSNSANAVELKELEARFGTFLVA